ncbi:MAG TPA: AraC family transcriptional regulator [Polyangiaceae bacterium]|nr:AraC family transcriptional regulator [Polyangiaceae bacterium]
MAATIVSALTATLLRCAVSLGLDGAKLLARAGLRAEDLDDPDGRTLLESHARLWEAVAAHGPEDVGLLVGQRFQPLGLGAAGHAIQLAPTLGDAVATFARFRRLVSPEGESELRIEGGEARFVLALPRRLARLRHPAEASAAGTITILRDLAGHHVVPLRLSFQHPAPSSVERHVKLFGVRPSFGAPANEMVVPAALLGARNARANPSAHKYLVRRAEQLAGEIGEESPIVDRVRNALLLVMKQGEPRADAVAKRLGLSTRTLHRRLAVEGSGLAAVLDALRRERAEMLLADPRQNVAEVATALGYRDVSTFGRAFRRWTGRSPSAFRSDRAARPTPERSSGRVH